MSVKRRTTGPLVATGATFSVLAATPSVTREVHNLAVHDPSGGTPTVDIFVNAIRIDQLVLAANETKIAVPFGIAANQALTVTVSAGTVNVHAEYTERSGGDV